MLGFATVDVSRDAESLTIWLTSQIGPNAAGHTNAVTFALDGTFDSVRAEGMVADRYVVVTDRTELSHPLVADWGVSPCDVDLLALEIIAGQGKLLDAIGKGAQPAWHKMPEAVDQAALDGERPAMLTLAVADRVLRTWTVWLATDSERITRKNEAIRRKKQVPDGLEGEAEALPARFVEQSTVHPLRVRT
jgi:hypothetical protein